MTLTQFLDHAGTALPYVLLALVNFFVALEVIRVSHRRRDQQARVRRQLERSVR